MSYQLLSERLRNNPALYERIENLGLNAKTYNALTNGGITYVGQLITLDAPALKRLKGIGDGSLAEVQSAVCDAGLELGMIEEGPPKEWKNLKGEALLTEMRNFFENYVPPAVPLSVLKGLLPSTQRRGLSDEFLTQAQSDPELVAAIEKVRGILGKKLASQKPAGPSEPGQG